MVKEDFLFVVPTRRQSLQLWAAAILLALIFHLGGLIARPFWLNSMAVPPISKRMPVDTVSPDQLQSLRKKWKLPPLVTKNLPRSETAPENARYSSDKNVRVEKEQRAKLGTEGGVKAKTRNTPPAAPTPPAQPKRSYQLHRARLGNLGVPFRLAIRPPKAMQKTTPEAQAAAGLFPGEGAEQQVREKLPEGSLNLLNAQESVFFSFFERMRESVQPNWVREARQGVGPIQKNLSPGDYYTVLEVTLDADGSVIETKIAQSSAIVVLDEAAKASFWRVRRFPNPPQGLRDPDGQIRFPVGFSFVISQDAALQYNYYDPWNYK